MFADSSGRFRRRHTLSRSWLRVEGDACPLSILLNLRPPRRQPAWASGDGVIDLVRPSYPQTQTHADLLEQLVAKRVPNVSFTY